MLYVLEDKKMLHFIDASNGNTNATIELKEKDLKLNVLGDGYTINIVQKKEIRILDGVDGSQKGSHELPFAAAPQIKSKSDQRHDLKGPRVQGPR